VPTFQTVTYSPTLEDLGEYLDDVFANPVDHVLATINQPLDGDGCGVSVVAQVVGAPSKTIKFRCWKRNASGQVVPAGPGDSFRITFLGVTD
jgi:hypothetical protein